MIFNLKDGEHSIQGYSIQGYSKVKKEILFFFQIIYGSNAFFLRS